MRVPVVRVLTVEEPTCEDAKSCVRHKKSCVRRKKMERDVRVWQSSSD
jgi:hypothetical protein